MKTLTQNQLAKLGHRSLYEHFKVVRAVISRIYHHEGPRCCNICKSYIGTNWQKDVADVAQPYEEYLDLARSELLRRPYVDFSKRAQNKAHKEMLADLKGNRNRLRNRAHHKTNTNKFFTRGSQ